MRSNKKSMKKMKASNVALLTVLGALLTMTGCVQYKLIPAGIMASVGTMAFKPSVDWNKSPLKVGKNTTVWTRNGLSIDELIFVEGLAEGGAIFKTRNKSLPMPKFSGDMLPNEVQTLVSSSIKNTADGQIEVNTKNLRPVMVGEHQGFRFNVDFFNTEGLKRKGDVLAVIRDEQLYAIISISAATHYYDSGLAEVEQIFASLSL